jgi:hypothetical protein
LGRLRAVSRISRCSGRWPSVWMLGLSVAVAVAMAPTVVVAAEPVAVEPVAVEPVVAEPTVAAPTVALADPEVIVQEGVALVAQGHAAQGADRLSSAYVVMPPSWRVANYGRQVVARAVNAYEASWGATRDRAHLEASQVLLAAYFADLGAARDAGQPTAAPDELEQQLVQRLAKLEQRLSELDQAALGIGPLAGVDISVVAEEDHYIPPPVDPRERRNALIMVGSGVAGLVVGGVMAAAGAVAASKAEERRSMMLVDDASDERGAKLTGTLVATAGALVFSGSVILVGVGSNRLGRLRERRRVAVHPTLHGLALHGRF